MEIFDKSDCKSLKKGKHLIIKYMQSLENLQNW